MSAASRLLGSATAVVGSLGVAGLAWGLTEAHLFTLREVTCPVLPDGREPLRVLHISDLHLLPRQRDKVAFVRELAELEPDLVINTGDNMASQAGMGTALEALDPLLDIPGAFVWGSNDYKAPQFKNPFMYLLNGRSHRSGRQTDDLPWQELGAALRERGWVDLTHQRHRLVVEGITIDLRGTDDGHLDRDDYPQVAGPVATDADLTLAVTHAPYLRLLDAMTADGVDVIFAGHTNGGQVCLPTGALITNCDLDTDRVKGLSTHIAGGHTSWLHVSAGLGTSPFAPYRIFCRPEATLVTLTPRAG